MSVPKSSGAAETPYIPAAYKPLVSGGHLMTLYAWGKPRHFPRLPPPIRRYFDVAPDARVLAQCHWHSRPWAQPTLLLLHGLEGSSEAHYMRGVADKAWAAGWNVVRLNQRNCGGTEHLSRGLYHSGLIGDPLSVIQKLVEVDQIRTIAVAGYSLGGNLALKLAGEFNREALPHVKAVVAISPTMDLARCVEALERRSNVVYQWNFVRNLKGRMRRKAAMFPGLYQLDALDSVRTVRQFDEAFTAPHHGFRDAADYYHRASALRVVGRVSVPALILTAEDDPFVPAEPFRDPAVTDNAHVTVVITPQGGHCAYVERGTPGYDGYWAEREIVRFIQHHRPDRLSSAHTPVLSPRPRV